MVTVSWVATASYNGVESSNRSADTTLTTLAASNMTSKIWRG
ncbi:MAG: hypothetical protein ACKVIQ_17690 [Acidimicrobiales bacterium]|jgi:hypothetical protein